MEKSQTTQINNWQPTNELRLRKATYYSTFDQGVRPKEVLQQRWVGEDMMLRKYFEWRDVPIVEDK